MSGRRVETFARQGRLFAAWRTQRGLTAHQAEVLVQVFDAGAVTAAALCRGLGLSTASMARLVGKLEAEGWILRIPDADDGRRLIVQPTKQLVRAVEELSAMLDAPPAPMPQVAAPAVEML